jgi:hypothetical protein
MAGREKGRPTKWVRANLNEVVSIGKPGIVIEIWEKWRKKDKKLGTLTISVGGLRWLPGKGKKPRQQSWKAVDAWFDGSS